MKTITKFAGLVTLLVLVPTIPTSADVPPVIPFTETARPTLVPADVMAKWTLVAQCESHQQWHKRGSRYSGGLGFDNRVWTKYGSDITDNAAEATPQQQVLVALRINGAYVPDQDGKCRNW